MFENLMPVKPEFLQIAVPTPLHRRFDYLPALRGPLPAIGARVRVPFGRRREVIGLVVGYADHSALSPGRLKRITETVDNEPLLPERLLTLLIWAAEYYHHPLGEVVYAAMPAPLRQGRPPRVPGETVWTLTAAGREMSPDALKRAPLRKKLLQALVSAPEGLASDALAQTTPRWSVAMKALQELGLVSAREQDHRQILGQASHPPPALNPSQQAAVQAITDRLEGFHCYLLHGVTGSGKTEVYLQAIEKVLDRARQALVLVPEIALTPQLVRRFQDRFRVPIAVLHSGLNDQTRLCAWLQARAGTASIVIGTRSAVFTPMKNLGLIVVDEEHDSSYKQQEGFRYSARDVAVMRAHHEGVAIVLGSATPSLESLNKARMGTYRLLELPDRTGSAVLPEVQLLDMRRQSPVDGLSHPLRMALAARLEKSEQSLLFLNRRGFAPVWMCHDCGWVAPCRRCDARLTYHQKSRKLRCHHCGAENNMPECCPVCQSDNLHPLGEGTERIEASLMQLFPKARIVRIDRDSTRRKGALEAQIKRIEQGEADILVGTQMLAKGHDFPNVTLVGVLNADQGLYNADFRSAEQMFQRILQVSGRAGRGAKPGQVLIQTWHPDHPLLAALKHHDYGEFANFELAERREADYPPFTHMALLRAESPKPGAAMKFLHMARALASLSIAEDKVQVMEPVTSPMERRAGRYRAQLLVQSKNRGPLHAFLSGWVAQLGERQEGKRVRWSLDVDPIDLY